MSEKCKIQKFKFKDFTILDEVYKRINKRMSKILMQRKVQESKQKTDKKGKILTEDDAELVDLMAEAVSGEDIVSIVKCGTNGCNVDELDWDEGMELFKKIVQSEENKDFFIRSYEAKIVALNPHASLSDSGISSSASSKKE